MSKGLFKNQNIGGKIVQALERQEEREEAFRNGFKAGMLEAVDIIFYMTAYTLNYKLDFGRKRLHRIMKDIYNNIDAFRTGHLQTEDFDTIKKQMQDLGVNIK